MFYFKKLFNIIPPSTYFATKLTHYTMIKRLRNLNVLPIYPLYKKKNKNKNKTILSLNKNRFFLYNIYLIYFKMYIQYFIHVILSIVEMKAYQLPVACDHFTIIII